ncbi:MAG: hypothetical protein U0Q03_04520 [Acidimicrobiales bacterium]
MPVPHRARPRARRRALRFEYDTHAFRVWLPPADDPVVIASFGDAASFAFELLDWEIEREALVLLDERRRVTALLVDPPAPVGVLLGLCDLPGLEVEYCQTLSIVTGEAPVEGPPPTRHREGYFALRRFHMLQGLQLMDVILVDPERVQSLAIACDPDPVWFEPWEPGEPVAVPLDDQLGSTG